jgi:hypothetical protein
MKDRDDELECRHNHEPEYRIDDVDEVDEIGQGEGMIL